MPPTDPSSVLAYFITFRTYGTWLHGDARTSVDRDHNTPGSDRVAPSDIRQQRAFERMRHDPFVLTPNQQETCAAAIQHLCKKRKWTLRALNVRSNHVHLVVSAPVLAEKVMVDLKKYVTKVLREKNEVAVDRDVWAYHGSTRLLFNAQAVVDACAYVVERQGDRQGIVGDVS